METDPKTATQTTLEERRREPRYSAEGRAVMVIEAGRRLVDMSDHGLCIAHMYPALASGMEIEVHFNEQVRKARVMWNRINADGVQSGFYLP
jgi:hypothetical protein